MKCPNCGAEIGDNKFCSYCGSQITSEMRKEQEFINKQGCPKCGSSNITFSREKQGEVRGKNSSSVVRYTVGLCKDCGHTWKIEDNLQPKKRKTWLWVLGWICIFPIPLTILMLRKKDMKPIIKYGIIAVAWLVYLLIGLSGNSNKSTSTVSSLSTQASEQQESAEVTTSEETIVTTHEEPTTAVIETESAEETNVEESETESKDNVDNEESSLEDTATEEVESVNSNMSDAELRDAYVSLATLALNQNFKDNFEIVQDDTSVMINVWNDGVGVAATMAKSTQNEELLTSWSDMKKNIQTLAESLTESAKELGLNDTIIVLNVLNDLNKSNTLLTFVEGVCIYDVLEE